MVYFAAAYNVGCHSHVVVRVHMNYCARSCFGNHVLGVHSVAKDYRIVGYFAVFVYGCILSVAWWEEVVVVVAN